MSSEPLHYVVRHVRRLVATEGAAAPPDQALLERFVTQGDEAAFTALVERHGPMVLGVCRRVLWQEQDAEDACQAAFLILARRAASIRKRGSVGSWLHGVAYRVAGRLRRDRGRRSAREKPLHDVAQADTSAEVTWREVRAVLDEELRRLPESFRAPLVLCYLEGRTRDEAAAELGWKASTLKGRLERGRELLRARLGRRGLSLSAALLASLCAEGFGSAALPAALLTATGRAALRLTAGAAATTVAPAHVLALTQGVLQALSASKLRRAALLLLLIGIALAGGAVVAHWAAQAPPAGTGKAAVPHPQAEAKPPADDAAAIAAERKKLQGTWRLVRTECDGRALADEDDTAGKCVIRGDHIDLRPRIQQKGDRNGVHGLFDRERLAGAVTLAPGRPSGRMTITGDWLSLRGRRKGTFQALYQVDGDTLKILLPPAGAEAPDEFRTVLDSGRQLFVFRRETADQQQLLGTSWLLVKTEVNGKDVSERDIGGFCWFDDLHVVLSPRVRVRRTDKGQSQEQLEDFTGTYRFGPDKRPGRLVIKGAWSTPEKSFGGAMQILYEVDGEVLKLRLFPHEDGPQAGAVGGPRVLTFRRDRRWERPGQKGTDEPPPAPAAAPAVPGVKVEAVKPPSGWRAKAVLPTGPEPNLGVATRLYTSLQISPGGDLLGRASGVTDLATGADLTYRPGLLPKPWIEFVGFTRDGRPLGLRFQMNPNGGSPPRLCGLADCISGRDRTPFEGALREGRAALSPDGRLLALSRRGVVKLVETASGRAVGVFDGPLEVDVEWLTFSADGKTLLAAGNEAQSFHVTAEQHAYLKLYEVATRKERAGRKQRGALGSPSFSPDGKRVALLSDDLRGRQLGTALRFWDAATLKDLGAVSPGPQELLRNFAFSPDGQAVALVSGRFSNSGQPPTPSPFVVIDLASGREVARVAPPACGFAAAAYAPDGRLLVTQDNHGTIRVWEKEPAAVESPARP
jgi:RNA polymerase sigma factor (sigma-70 family)